MSNILTKPYTAKQKADFIVEHNHNKGLRIYETETALYALADYEVVQDGQIVDISDSPEYQAELARQEQERINQEAERFLNETDWMVIRHRDQLALGIPTSLTEEEFRKLLEDRQQARDRVIKE